MPSKDAVLRQWNFNLPIAALVVNRNGDWVAAAMADGSMRLLPAHAAAERPKEMNVHKGVSLALQPDSDAHAFLSGGDDGRVFIIDPKIDAPTLLAEHKNSWIDHVTGSNEGEWRAYAIGKKVYLIDGEGDEKLGPAILPSSAGGLAFSPNGKRLAASHYNGVSLFWTKAKASEPVMLGWKGSHLGLTWQPDGKILLTSLQENALHGWRLSDNNEMRLQGYAAKIHSVSWTQKGKYLATSGAPQIICWPFFSGGPWGKSPLVLGGHDARLITRVAAHPKDELVAGGYADGMIILAPLDGRMEIMIHAPQAEKGAGVTGLVWNGAGDCLFASLENGCLLLFTIESVAKAVAHA
jgi:WD40 repeat protein